ncbi:LacI family transcriptional regulator [Agromyces cerinus]|nr:LacI family transcriptional regulator [Agromyces cerinus]
MTVSRTLSGGANVRPDLQEKVLVSIRELGYHRNENARSLRPGHSTGLIGVAITNLGNPYYGNFALGVEEVAAQHGRRIIIGSTGEDPARERQLVSDFIGRQVEGLVLVPSGGSGDHLSPDRLGGVPLVLASRGLDGRDVDTVLLDDVGGAAEGTRALLEAGHTRIAFLGNARSVFTSERRFEGFARALAERGLVPDDELVERGQQDVASAEVATRRLLDLEHPPTAIFSANNRNSIGALHEIARRLKTGEVAGAMPALASFDAFELAGLMPVPVTIVDHDPRELGRQAAHLLFARLGDESVGRAARIVELPIRVVAAT